MRLNEAEQTAARQALLSALRMALQSEASVYLVYAPELADPLMLREDERRARQSLGHHATDRYLRETHSQPWLIELDARRVAPHLLETHPALDDPALEASITQALAELDAQHRADPLASNDESYRAIYSVGGWIVSQEPLTKVAHRVRSLSVYHASMMAQPQADDRRTLAWHDPRVLRSVWPLLSAEHQHGLLGAGQWFLFSPQGQVLTLRGLAQAPADGHPMVVTPTPRFSLAQRRQVLNAPLVDRLRDQWQAQLEQDVEHTQRPHRLPTDAEARLHRWVQEGQDWHLSGDDLMFYVGLAWQWPPAVMKHPEWQAVVQRAAQAECALRDGVRDLSDDFWRMAQQMTTSASREE